MVSKVVAGWVMRLCCNGRLASRRDRCPLDRQKICKTFRVVARLFTLKTPKSGWVEHLSGLCLKMLCDIAVELKAGDPPP